MFTFGLATTSPTVPFVIDANTGVISVSSTLDYETTQQYSFTVGAQLLVLSLGHLSVTGVYSETSSILRTAWDPTYLFLI